MRIRSLTLATFAVLALAGCGKPIEPGCIARELGNGVVSLQRPDNSMNVNCTPRGSAQAMADYANKRPELDIWVSSYDRHGAITTLTAKTKSPVAQ